jgi:hypothetical protein
MLLIFGSLSMTPVNLGSLKNNNITTLLLKSEGRSAFCRILLCHVFSINSITFESTDGQSPRLIFSVDNSGYGFSPIFSMYFDANGEFYLESYGR